ncbi:MAG: ATP-binding protein [Nitrospiraceae bacterium]|nr:ATP-binding protein [Nitrospiraceae bacterium]
MKDQQHNESRLERLEEKYGRAQEELRQALAMERKARADLQQFVNIVSHDLRSPISTASSFLTLVSTKYGEHLDPKVKEYIGYSVTSLKDMERLISDLLFYVKIGSRKVEPATVDLNTVLEHALANLRVRIKESGARVKSGKLPTVRGDEILLVRLFQNLISNGLTWNVQAPEIEISARSGNGEWVFGFRDNGPGIKPEDQKKIFKPFGRLHHAGVSYRGTGLGLSTCQKIVEWHNGLIWVESVPGEGSTFYFTLPGEKPKA